MRFPLVVGSVLASLERARDVIRTLSPFRCRWENGWACELVRIVTELRTPLSG